MFQECRIYKNNDGSFRVISQNVRFKAGSYGENKKYIYKYAEDNNLKLVNNIIRAKSNIYDYCRNNQFKFFFTGTIKEEFNRYDLNKLIKCFSQIVRELRRNNKDLDLKYIIVPEQHKNGAWHIHGLLSEDFKYDFYINKNNYLSFNSYDKIGFSSISIIENYEATIKYVIKYISKTLSSRKKNERLFYHSNNLEKSLKIKELILINGVNNWDYINEFCCLSFFECEEELNQFFYNIRNKIYRVL